MLIGHLWCFENFERSFPADGLTSASTAVEIQFDAPLRDGRHVPIHRIYRLDEIAQAHADIETGLATGKLVVLP